MDSLANIYVEAPQKGTSYIQASRETPVLSLVITKLTECSPQGPHDKEYNFT